MIGVVALRGRDERVARVARRLSDQDGSRQTTLRAPIHCTGIGLHRGVRTRLRLCPADADTGIRIRRTDVAADIAEIPLDWRHVVDTTLCTVVANQAGVCVGTVEHLMAALAGCGVDNAVVELDGPEVPIMDGSSADFVFLIESAGLEQQAAARRAIRVTQPVTVSDGGATARLEPADETAFEITIDFPSPVIGRQERAVRLTPQRFKRELARARTFGFLKDVEHLRARGQALGGSLKNAIVVDEDRVLNPDGLRYDDEFARHKLLDAIGDLYLAGAPIIGRFTGHCSGHALNHRLVATLLADDGAHVMTGTTRPEDERGGRPPRQMKAAAPA